ncbi:hypothetical protein Pst134EA_000996 [Puccinia striiformis f. sp. tritici]|uniref:hypothetical protein n=1 Tax=Puccinia striiformis f. sp. tritici TaxID=168172 RepID=UPI002007DCA6|nr:hypothetical protein Pst134EA_000996 [Puccinia striiformis f. sp. tritici]KAH9467181.1 hypothetical protein Pst134EB_002203 [Puccinia striiformis f. sp. tritici]KAH9473939.1 hypothetical protein Pst134EA_000996 [Puccinia striiformis f. sp. tritici]KAI9600044.1 hypothetical protein KEM48_000259 [Puccinia striiformis f. sp. tritici PST-130]KAI9600781.1 hypothetical protein H4Q26_000574 [Puccinia striiformis f. sp. tritici PST-130]
MQLLTALLFLPFTVSMRLSTRDDSNPCDKDDGMSVQYCGHTEGECRLRWQTTIDCNTDGYIYKKCCVPDLNIPSTGKVDCAVYTKSCRGQ